MNKIILYIATSNDGFIANVNGEVDWLPQPNNENDLEIVGYKKLMDRIDVILMGSKSFKQIISFGDWAWTDKCTYVFSSSYSENDRNDKLSCITITNDNPIHFMKKMQDRKSGKDIWLLGGAQLAKSFAEENLIDEIVLTIVPQNLRSGIPLALSFDMFNLTEEKPLMDGMIQKIYLNK